ncbi:MAG: FkbM family methyltransferase [Verrucomicrobiaceae bacterium]
MISYAQNYEDVILHRALKDIPKGFYIDVGAEDPVICSVTKAFYDLGWSGINIEALAHHHLKLRQDRPRDLNIHACAGEKMEMADFFEISDRALSTLDAEVAAEHEAAGLTVWRRTMPVVTLDSVLEKVAPEAIHFLKVDVEGAEASVLRGLNLKRYRPWIIVMEATKPYSQIPTHDAFEPLLTAADYPFCYFDGLNRFYVAAEHREKLGPLVALPPNIFDGFVRFEEVELRKRVANFDGTRLQAARDDLARARRKHFGKRNLKLDDPEPRPNLLKKMLKGLFRPQGSVNKSMLRCLTHMIEEQRVMEQRLETIEESLPGSPDLSDTNAKAPHADLAPKEHIIFQRLS